MGIWILVVVLLQGGQVVQGKMVGAASEAECREILAAYQEKFSAAPEVKLWGQCVEVGQKQPETPKFKKERDS